MGKLIKILALFIFLLMPEAECFAQIISTNTDTKTIEQVGMNTAAIVAVEDAHNAVVDSIKNKQLRLSVIVGTLTMCRSLFHEVKKNVKGFGTESAIYKRIYSVGGEIMNNSVIAIGLIQKSELVQKTVALIAVSELLTKSVQTGQMFAAIVANCKVKNPLDKSGKAVPKNQRDGYNILNRDERLTLANQLLYNLEEYNKQLYRICVLAKYSTVQDLVAKIDAQSWYKYLAAKSTCNDLIDKWNRLSNYRWSF